MLKLISSIFKTSDKNLIVDTEKEIFLTKCTYCNKRMAVKTDKFVHGMYSCNECASKTSCVRNGIDEAFETDLFDELGL